MENASDPVLNRFRAALNEAYGERIERVVLFGSRARGDARPDSDYDVAVFLKDRSPDEGTAESNRAKRDVTPRRRSPGFRMPPARPSPDCAAPLRAKAPKGRRLR